MARQSKIALTTGLVSLLLAVACGGTARPPAASSSGGSSGDPTMAGGASDDSNDDGRGGGAMGAGQTTATKGTGPGAATGAGGATAGGASSSSGASTAQPKKSPEEAHAQFMGECAKSQDLNAYCECAWGVTKKTLPADDIAADKTNPEKMAQLQGLVMHECAAQLPEAAVKKGYVEGCERNEPGMRPYCECVWPELRSKLSIAELASPEAVHTPKFAAAVKASANKCTTKLPEDVVKKSFLSGCGGGRSESDAFCACAWKELRSKMSLADIQSAGVGDPTQLDQMKANIGKTCGNLKPGAGAGAGAGAEKGAGSGAGKGAGGTTTKKP